MSLCLTAALILLFLFAVLARLAWWLHRRRNWKAYVASDAFLQSREWRVVRYEAFKANNGRCEVCGRNKHQLPPGEYLCADHIKPRRRFPELALDVRNIQIICTAENHAKGNIDETDWRHPSHPHRH